MEGLTDEQREHVLHAARGGIIDLLGQNPALAVRFGADDLTQVFLAGVVAGVDATVRVFELVARDGEEGP
jgi:hypothetical protein